MFENIEKSINQITRAIKPTNNIVELGNEIYQLHRLIEFIIFKTDECLTQNLTTLDPNIIKKLKNDFTTMQFDLIENFSLELDFNIENSKEKTDEQTNDQQKNDGNELKSKSKNQVKDEDDSEASSL